LRDSEILPYICGSYEKSHLYNEDHLRHVLHDVYLIVGGPST